MQADICAPGKERWMSRISPPEQTEDETLVTRFLEGDNTAFDSLFGRYQRYVYNISYGIVGNAEEARDLTQEVFLQVHHALPRFRHGSRFATWLYRITVNRASDSARAAKRRERPSIWENLIVRYRNEEEENEQPEEIFLKHEKQDRIQEILMLCPPMQREALVLRYYQELNLEEMAQALGCSPDAAKVRLYRARNCFRRLYLETVGREDASEKPKEESHAPESLL